MKIPKWAQILIGIGIVVVFLGVGAIIAVTAWVSENLNVSTTSQRDAETEFERVRQSFPGRPPLLEIKNGAPHYVAERTAMPASTQQLQTLYVLAWEPRDQKMAKVSVPWWLVRLKSEPIRFSAYASGFDDGGVNLKPEEVEKYGPGIILEARGRHGERVLLWAQ